MRFQLQKKNMEMMVENAKAIHKRADALKKTETFRTEIPPPKSGYRRTTEAKFSGEAHKVASIDAGARVTDTKDKTFQTKFTRPVAADSKTVEDADVRTTKDNRQRDIMKPFADRLVREIGQGNTVNLSKASTFYALSPTSSPKPEKQACIRNQSLRQPCVCFQNSSK